MRQAHDVATVRAAESALMATLPPGTLMTRAAHGLASTCVSLLNHVYGARVVLLVGSGDNGGDALFAGALLARRGARVDAVPLGSRTHQAGLAALRAAGGRLITPAAAGPALDAADLVLDGIVGIGGRGALRPPADALAARAAASGVTVVAVDVPSGVDSDTGAVEGAAVRADVTVTFGTLKPGLLVDPGAGLAGVVELVDIGLGPFLPEPGDATRGGVLVATAGQVAALLPRPGRESDKYRRGVLGVVAGSAAYQGAAVLCVAGALRAGAGMVRFVGEPATTDAVRAAWPEVVAGEGRVQAWAVGPGLGRDERARARLRQVIEAGEPVVVDADALSLLAEEGSSASGLDRHAPTTPTVPRPPTVLTPHAGELARLLGTDRDAVEARRLDHARRAADQFGAVVLLKGSTTVIAEPEGRTAVNPTGTGWLATAGSGDVLTGAVGALLAQGLAPFDAAVCAAWLHGLAGRIAAADAPCTAGDVAEALPAAIREVVRR